jgi:hypothetical protein
MNTPATRLLLIASVGLLLTARTALGSQGQAVEPAPTDPPQPVQAGGSADTAPAPTVDDAVAPADAARDAVAIEEVAPQDAVTPADVDTQTPGPKMTGTVPVNMDHSVWPAIVFTPADGSVTHNPSYMGTPPMGEDIVNPLHAPDPVWQIQEALAGADAGNLNGENLLDLGAQPFIGLVKFFIIPVRAIFEHPLSDVTSP